MRVIEFECDHPILRETLRRVPGIELEWIQSDIREDTDRIRALFWARGGDFEAFEAALEADPTVAVPLRTVDLEGRRLYQLEFVDEGPRTSIYPMLVEEGCVIQSLRGTSDGWGFRVSFPTEVAVSRVFSFLAEENIPFTIHRLFEERSDDDYGLTESQAEAISVALEAGYFDVPRRTNLENLAADLGISDTATSQRLRRGMKTVLDRTVNSTATGALRQRESSRDQSESESPSRSMR